MLLLGLTVRDGTHFLVGNISYVHPRHPTKEYPGRHQRWLRHRQFPRGNNARRNTRRQSQPPPRSRQAPHPLRLPRRPLRSFWACRRTHHYPSFPLRGESSRGGAGWGIISPIHVSFRVPPRHPQLRNSAPHPLGNRRRTHCRQVPRGNNDRQGQAIHAQEVPHQARRPHGSRKRTPAVAASETSATGANCQTTATKQTLTTPCTPTSPSECANTASTAQTPSASSLK